MLVSAIRVAKPREQTLERDEVEVEVEAIVVDAIGALEGLRVRLELPDLERVAPSSSQAATDAAVLEVFPGQGFNDLAAVEKLAALERTSSSW